MAWYDNTDDLIALLRETDVKPDPSALERLRRWLRFKPLRF